MFAIGPHTLQSPLVLAPMAGVTDLPFRQLCRDMGAGLAVTEMVHSNPELQNSRKSLLRVDHRGEPGPVSVQIVGSEPDAMAQAARHNVAGGADIIDINMGCPAKKVCKKAAGSALLRDEQLVASILRAIVAAVDVPVTLKIRTGWDPETINARTIAHMAEDCGIQALSIHGRTRQCRFNGNAEYDTIAEVAQERTIPVIANGDIASPQQALQVLNYTGATAIMIGRAAQGNPWIFAATRALLQRGIALPPPGLGERRKVMLQHLLALHRFYGERQGVRIARKHMGWYLTSLKAEGFRRRFNTLGSAIQQQHALEHFFDNLTQGELAA